MLVLEKIILFLKNSEETVSLWKIITLFVPIFSGVIVAVVTSHLQFKKERRQYSFQVEKCQRDTLLKAYDKLQGSILRYITALMDIQKLLKVVSPNNPNNSFSCIDLEIENGNIVLQNLNSTLSSISIGNIKKQTSSTMIKNYCDLILSNQQLALDTLFLPNVYKEFGAEAASSALFLGGDDWEDYNAINQNASFYFSTNIGGVSFWRLQNEVVECSKRCCNRLRKMMGKKGNEN